MRLKTNMIILIATMLPGAGLSAQIAEPAPGPIAGGMVLAQKGGMIAMHIDEMDAAPVKGAPFCATVTTEHTQSFTDGNRIHTSDNSTLCRDSEGRTRREAGLNLLAAGGQTSAAKMITIVDPVAGVRYMLDPDNKVAHKMNLPPPGSLATRHAGSAGKGERMTIYQTAGRPDAHTFSTNVFFKKEGQDANEPAPATEDLGEQTINGIRAAGTRITTTIPSGKMGNEKPISVSSERWYSADLKATVMTKHDDPWAGELKTEFSNVNTSEPDPSKFTVPSDYTIVNDKEGPIKIQLAAPAPPAQ
jgi:hypothetical protein